MISAHAWWLWLSIFTSCAAAATEAEWVLQKDESRIQLYTRPVPDSPFLEVRVTALIDAPIRKVAMALGDGDGCSAWRAMCKSSEILITVSDTEHYIYLVLDLPWPVSDRDMVIHSIAQVDREAGTVTVHFDPASSRQPEQDYVRAESTGLYQARAISAEQVEFTYIMHTDIGGDLSADIINPRLADSTYEDVKRLQALAEQ